MGGYPIVTIEEPTVDGHGRVGDEDEDDSMLVDEEVRALKNTLFEAWRNVMWRVVSLFMLRRSRFISEVIWSTPAKLNPRRAGNFTGILLPIFRCVAGMEVRR